MHADDLIQGVIYCLNKMLLKAKENFLYKYFSIGLTKRFAYRKFILKSFRASKA